jgi:hypothetical protein
MEALRNSPKSSKSFTHLQLNDLRRGSKMRLGSRMLVPSHSKEKLKVNNVGQLIKSHPRDCPALLTFSILKTANGSTTG